jgi:hypothetical protein
VFGVLHARSSWELSRRLRRPFSRQPYHRGRFLRAEELRSDLAATGWETLEIAEAVRFPPLRLPVAGWYRAWARLCRGGVLLARARAAAAL